MKFYCSLVLAFVLFGCSDNRLSDEELLERDQKELLEALDDDQVFVYKFAKIVTRASAEPDTTSEEYKAFITNCQTSYNNLSKAETEQISLRDFITMNKEYKATKEFVKETDEDLFPTLTDAYGFLYGEKKPTDFASGSEKLKTESMEHAGLSAMAIISREMGEKVALYECHEAETQNLNDDELKGLISFLKGFLYFEKELLYLANNEISNNIVWLNKHPELEFPLTHSLFKWENVGTGQTHSAFHAVNHLFRALCRFKMDRDIDEERAFQDLQVFVDDAKKVGFDNEIVWAAEAALCMKKCQTSEEKIASLNQLNKSQYLSKDEIELINSNITYLEKQESDDKSFLDKTILIKAGSKYMMATLAKVDWKTIMKDNNVPYGVEMIEHYQSFMAKIDKLSKATSAENLKEKGKNLWDDAKGLVE